jgi:hypothetical protein
MWGRLVPYRRPTAESWGSAKTFLALRLEIEMSMNKKGKFVAELSDEKWLSDLALLCDICHHVNNFNTKLQGQQISFLICLGLSEFLN